MIALTLAALAYAQEAEVAVPAMNVQTWRVPIDAERTLWTDDAATAPDGWHTARLAVGWVHEPLVYTWNDGERVSLLTDAVQADLVGGVVWKRLRVGLDVPLVIASSGAGVATGTGLGDIAIDGKGTILDPEESPVGLAVGTRLFLPTATVRGPLGSEGLAGSVHGIVDRRFGPVLVAANVGTTAGPRVELENVTLDDAFFARLGVGWEAREGMGVSLDIAGQATYASPLSARVGAPVEALVGAWRRVSGDFVLRGGLGRGLNGGIGAPVARGLVLVAWEPERVRDRDEDGLVDPVDACPLEAEDADGFEDSDGCPERDNDGDLIVDPSDNCPNVAEDRDDWQDDDGCPDAKTLLRVRAIDPEGAPIAGAKLVLDGVAVAGTGTFETEVDAGSHRVALAAPGYVATDVVLDVPDGPPYEHVVTLMRDKPPGPPPRVEVTKERLVITDKIYFETNKATIKRESYSLLDEIAAVLTAHPDILRVRIEGHTDSRGKDSYNLSLSDQRAAAVRQYLVGKGIDPARLVSQGFGEGRPVDPAENEAAWEKNRRVEFVIEAWKD